MILKHGDTTFLCKPDRHEEEVTACKLAIDHDAQDARPYYSLGVSLYGLSRWEESAAFEKFLKLWERDDSLEKMAKVYLEV